MRTTEAIRLAAKCGIKLPTEEEFTALVRRMNEDAAPAWNQWAGQCRDEEGRPDYRTARRMA